MKATLTVGTYSTYTWRHTLATATYCYRPHLSSSKACIECVRGSDNTCSELQQHLDAFSTAWMALAQLTLVQLAPAQTRDWQGCEVPLTLCQGFGKGESKGLCFSTPPNPSLHMFTLHTLHTPEIS